uniref:Uncharacterized protein n=1 Tax=Pediastrum duplex TaxID=3105 RepID=A0A2U8GIR1_PEDDU|nr:hypothetical protein [Pediastrum duplex]
MLIEATYHAYRSHFVNKEAFASFSLVHLCDYWVFTTSVEHWLLRRRFSAFCYFGSAAQCFGFFRFFGCASSAKPTRLRDRSTEVAEAKTRDRSRRSEEPRNRRK